MKKDSNRLLNAIRENRKTILWVNAIICFVSFLLAFFGRAVFAESIIFFGKVVESNVIYDISKEVFIASFLSLITLIINWKTDNEYEDIKERIIASELVIGNYLSRNCLFCKSSFIAVYKNRIDANLGEFFTKAKKRIWILTTNLESITEYKDLIAEKSKTIDVKICTLDPTSPSGWEFIKARELDSRTRALDTLSTDELRQNPHYGNLLQKMKYALIEFIEVLKENQDSIIKVYSVPPSTIQFISDDECILAFMIDESKSRDTIHLHFLMTEKNPEVYCFETHFDRIFQDARTIDLDEVQEWQPK